MMMELILSIFILSIILVSFVQIISKTYAQKNDKINIVIATSLAQEGIELVRNARDINWLAATPINGFTNWTDTYKNISYNSISLTSATAACAGATGCLLYIDSNGFYTTNSAGGAVTIFSRKVNVSTSGSNKTITSTIFWNDQSGNPRNISIVNTLTNWGDI